LLRPAIVLPVDAEVWLHEELARALIHELEHVRRADWATQFAARVVCAFYWFHPLVWIGWHRLGLEAERSCNDEVLRRAKATDYAHQLVFLAERFSNGTRGPLLGMATCRELTTRVGAVLDSAQTRGRAGATRVITAAVLSAVIVAMVGPLRAIEGRAGQAPSVPLKLEVASVRPNTSEPDERSIQRTPGGRFVVDNLPLRDLIIFAYQLQDYQLVDAPDWLVAERFNIVAKAEREPSGWLDEIGLGRSRIMMQNLLVERFSLAVHKETRDLPIFELTLARSDGKPGPKLLQSTTNCAVPGPQRTAGPRGCGMTIRPEQILFGGFPLDRFVSNLSGLVHRIVVDRTGLTGNWDFELSLPPGPDPLTPATLPPSPPQPGVDPKVAWLSTALEEQLGLQLRPARGPVEVLVVDGVKRPTQN